ncbi:MAG: PilZ domain-containing protein [Candidatus Latescibacterota bacterium]
MNSHSDKRDFDRFPIESEIEVIGTDNEGRKFLEKTMLKDISGGGGSFIPNQVGNYFTGQPLELKIHLPGEGDLSACMEGNARVIRIIKTGDFEKDERVVVILDNPLHLKYTK